MISFEVSARTERALIPPLVRNRGRGCRGCAGRLPGCRAGEPRTTARPQVAAGIPAPGGGGGCQRGNQLTQYTDDAGRRRTRRPRTKAGPTEDGPAQDGGVHPLTPMTVKKWLTIAVVPGLIGGTSWPSTPRSERTRSPPRMSAAAGRRFWAIWAACGYAVGPVHAVALERPDGRRPGFGGAGRARAVALAVGRLSAGRRYGGHRQVRDAAAAPRFA